MTTPLTEYLSVLQKRDRREKASKRIVDQYNKLADRTAEAARKSARAAESPASTPAPATAPSPTPSSRAYWSGTARVRSPPVPQESASPASISQLRTELAAAHKTRANLETQLASITTELSDIKATSTDQKLQIERLEKSKKDLDRKFRDRVDEIRGKAQFSADMQDETLALNIQLNVAEQEMAKLKAENEMLTRRWMDKMREDADKMNDRFEREATRARR